MVVTIIEWSLALILTGVGVFVWVCVCFCAAEIWRLRK